MSTKKRCYFGLDHMRLTISKIIENLPFSKLIKDHMSDKTYIKHVYRLNFNCELNLQNPRTFNEKLQWLKLYNRSHEFVKMVDKHKAKDYVASIIGKDYIIPTIGVWNSVETIDWDSLPKQFVIKCTHDSGGLIICKDKSKLNLDEAKARLQYSLNHDYYMNGREWPYKDVPRKIIAEKFMEDETSQDLKDYKFFCFNGKVEYFKVDFDRYSDHRANYYNRHGIVQPFGEQCCPYDLSRKIELPDNIEEMIFLAEKLSADIPFLRVDFYSINNHIYFGELTFFPASGFGKFSSEYWDEKLGSLIHLPNINVK